MKADPLGRWSLEHSTWAYRADLAAYAAAVVLLAGYLALRSPDGRQAALSGFVAGGLLGWTLLEYVIHRFVFHGIEPFRRLHAQHHLDPSKNIITPTVLTAMGFFVLVFLPVLVMSNAWYADAVTLGILTGNLAYGLTHHAVHHWRGQGSWLRRRKRWHALHHHLDGRPSCFGVTSPFWDLVFRTGRAPLEIPAGDLRRRGS